MERKRLFVFISAMFIVLLSSVCSEPADVIIIGDIRLKPVSDIVTVIRESIPSETAIYLPKDVIGVLASIVRKENARVVIALGGESINDALSLPESTPLIYGLLIKPPVTKRPNITGVYMTTPVSEYASLIERHLPGIRRLGTVIEPETSSLPMNEPLPATVTFYRANNSYEFIKSVSSLGGKVDALILLPEKNLLTSTAMEELYRRSFAEKVPVIGVSEKHVKMGSLLALVFDEAGMGRQIGALAQRVLSRGSASGIAPAHPEAFNLYLNIETARTMKISLPPELIRKARGVYP